MFDSDNLDDFNTKYGKAVARAWTEADYKAKLLDDPHAALAEVGIEVPSGVNVNVTEVDAENVQLVLPTVPEGEVTDEEMAQALGGINLQPLCSMCGKLIL